MKKTILVIACLASFGAQADNREFFQSKSINDVYTKLNIQPVEDKSIRITSPDIAESAATVPVQVSTNLDAAKIVVLYDKNPSVVSIVADVSNASASKSVNTRIKAAETGNVIGLVITKDGKAYFNKKATKVTVGGCGG